MHVKSVILSDGEHQNNPFVTLIFYEITFITDKLKVVCQLKGIRYVSKSF